MPLIFVTGVSGSGKSAVLQELEKQSFEAHGIDEEGLADWVDRETGATVPFPHDNPEIDIHDWYQKHRWVSSLDHTRRLKEQADQEDISIFLIGLAEDEDKVWHLFDKIIYLAVDETTMKDRIKKREDNHFGKTAEEMAVILSWLERNDGHYRNSGAYTVDAARPLNDVVDDILLIALDRQPLR